MLPPPSDAGGELFCDIGFSADINRIALLAVGAGKGRADTAIAAGGG